MVRRLDKAERGVRLRQLARTATLSLVLFATAAVAVGYIVYKEPQFGGIGCTECLSHAAEYRDHLTGVKPMTDAALAISIKTHLELCKCCGAKFRQAYPDVSLARVGMENQLLEPHRFAFTVASNLPGY